MPRRRTDAVDATRPAAEEDDAAEVTAADEGVEAGTARGVVEADHEQLAGSLAGVHAATMRGAHDAGGAGGAGARACSSSPEGSGRSSSGAPWSRAGAEDVPEEEGVVAVCGEEAQATANVAAATRDGRREGAVVTASRGLWRIVRAYPRRASSRVRAVVSRGRGGGPGRRAGPNRYVAAVTTDPTPVVLDVDTGVDDACALLLAPSTRPSTCGPSPASVATRRSTTSCATRCSSSRRPVAPTCPSPAAPNGRCSRLPSMPATSTVTTAWVISGGARRPPGPTGARRRAAP